VDADLMREEFAAAKLHVETLHPPPYTLHPTLSTLHPQAWAPSRETGVPERLCELGACAQAIPSSLGALYNEHFVERFWFRVEG